MAFNSTVQEMVNHVRQRTNMENCQFVTDQEIVDLLNRAHNELYDIVVGTNEDYFVNSFPVTLAAGTDAYALPADFYKVLGVDLNIDAERSISLKKFQFTERNRYKTTIYAPHIPASIYQYHVVGTDLKFIPKPREAKGATLWYVPLPKKFVLVAQVPAVDTETTSLDLRLAMYDDYLTLDAAINVLVKEETDASVLMAEREVIKQRIIQYVTNRDVNEPERVTDSYSANYPNFNAVFPW
jgi:hypothetical protein